MDSIPLLGSAYHAHGALRPGHRHIGDLDDEELAQPVDVTLLLRERRGAPTVAESLEWTQTHAHAPHLTAEQITGVHGSSASDRNIVTAWAGTAGLKIVRDDPLTRRVTVRAPAGHMADVLGVRLERIAWDASWGTVQYRGHRGPLRLPPELAGTVDAVLGLDNRPLARPHLRAATPDRPSLVSYDPTELAAVYDFPPLPNRGEGMRLVAGMIELGGVVHPADVAAAFHRMGLRPPTIVNVSVDGTLPRPDPEGADVEIALDYQAIGGMVLAMAPLADLTIVSYNAENSERGFVDAAAAAASDRAHRPAAVSISWGSSEDNWSAQGLRALDSVFATGSLRGVSYTAAAGDAGSGNAAGDGHQHAEFPASSPHVWACGGTTLLAVGDRIVSETVWNELDLGAGAAGSGVSRAFPTPAYQARAGLRPRAADGGSTGRGLPDGSGVADPVTGWNVLALGRLRVTGGTSAVAPMYAALWTLIAGLRGRPLGMPHPSLYAARGRGFRDVVSGNTGGPYSARRGWDTASGWGTPDGRALAAELGVPERTLAVVRRGAATVPGVELD